METKSHQTLWIIIALLIVGELALFVFHFQTKSQCTHMTNGQMMEHMHGKNNKMMSGMMDGSMMKNMQGMHEMMGNMMSMMSQMDGMKGNHQNQEKMKAMMMKNSTMMNDLMPMTNQKEMDSHHK